MKRNRVAALSATALLTAGLLIGVASPAHAIPGTCTADTGRTDRVSSYCATGTGEHQIAVSYLHRNGQRMEAKGSWASVGQTSYADINGTVLLWWINLR
ncbi:hypothetical protein [Streptosporangium carneum]|uniref:Streptomyces killer toxin-like beta/gamma crystallin domain-containing protein n=1 Tax=Streptosporangium carneum TaxID=47481 RepID=A0A9W6I950_9ACTN|nr:hypothetical protein [Streptosporangium carneum]GLK13478.1 hypothetical protein GCM10017600_68890 [Streptosporangium carneum]